MKTSSKRLPTKGTALKFLSALKKRSVKKMRSKELLLSEEVIITIPVKGR